MTITTHDLGTGVSYLDPGELPALLTQLEFDVSVPYADQEGIATIGIGVNLTVHDSAGHYPNLALVLDYLGVLPTYLDEVNAARTAAGEGLLTTQESNRN